jgi:hypothetical protein
VVTGHHHRSTGFSPLQAVQLPNSLFETPISVYPTASLRRRTYMYNIIMRSPNLVEPNTKYTTSSSNAM